jgi:hypothetical protein
VLPEKKGIGIGLIWWQAQALKKLDGVFPPMLKSLPSNVL